MIGLITAVFWPITILKLLRKLKPETWLLPVSVRKIPTTLSTGMITSSMCIDGIALSYVGGAAYPFRISWLRPHLSCLEKHFFLSNGCHDDLHLSPNLS